MNVLSLFDGISCGQIALQKAGIDVSRYYASEIELGAIEITQHNYPDTIQIGDVTKVNFNDIDDIDLLIGGSPCNYWTIAKTNREVTCEGVGFSLFLKYVEALRIVKPRWFLYENNFSIHKDIQNEITKLLGVTPIMINSCFVSAQNRKRLYWTNIPNVMQPNDLKIKLNDIVGEESYCVAQQPFKRKKINGKYDRRYEARSDYKSGTVVGTREGQLNMVAIKAEPNNSNCKVENGIYHDVNKSYPINMPDGYYIIRSFSIEEREKLQTLPSGYTSIAKNNIAKRAIGNGWTVDVIAHIFKGLDTYMNKQSNN